MDDFSKSSCRSCGAEIIWAKTTTNRRMPVDAEPSDNGNIRLVERQRNGPLAVYDNSDTDSLFGDEDRYLSHFVTCPEAPDWRKR